MTDMWVAIDNAGLMLMAISADGESSHKMAEKYQSKGCFVKKVSYAEFEIISEKSGIILDAQRQASHDAHPQFKPMHIEIAKIPPKGMKVHFRYGECFGDEIAWGEAEEGLLVVVAKCNLKGESGVVIKALDGSDCGWGYAGYEKNTLTWWRYADEIKPGVYREHCMQVLLR